MSRYIRYIASLISGGIAFTLLSSVASAAPFFTPSAGETLSSKMSVRGEISTNASQTWGGKLITDFDTVNTPITPSTPSQELYFDNNTQTFSGFLIMTALCMTSDCKDPSDTSKWDQSAFVSFAHGVSGQEVRLQDNGGDIYTLSGFAWSPSVGWIAFGVGADPVRYDRNTGNFSGYAWSDIIGYIKFAGLKMASKAPVLTGSDIKVANHNATITVSGATTSESGYSQYQLSSPNFSISNPSSPTGSFAGIDLREAKLSGYAYTLKDPYGNQRTGDLRVVAGAPTTVLDTAHKISSSDGKATYVSTGGVSSPADGSTEQEVSIYIRDKYGNPLTSQAGIKDVKYSLTFQNSISPNQIRLPNSSSLDGKSIEADDQYGLSLEFIYAGGEDFATRLDNRRKIFSLSQYSVPNITSTDGFTSMKIKSWIPGTLLLASGSVQVQRNSLLDSSIAVGQGNTTLAGLSTNIDFSAPWQGTFSLSGTTTDDVFGLNIPFKTNAVYTSSSANPPGGSTHHLYRFSSGADVINFLTLSGASNTMMIGDYYYTGDKTSDTGFELLPRLVASTLTGFTFNINHTALRMVTRNESGTPYYLAYPIGTSTANATANRGVKILGTAGGASDSFFALSQAESYTRAGDFRKPQVRDLIRQNVEEIKRKTPSGVLVKSGDYTMTPADMTSQTIIVTGGDFTIDQNDFGTGSSSPKAIIVLGGDVIIGSNVQNIYASIYTDHGIRNDIESTKQLYIYGTVISGNTIGTSASTTSTACPDFLTTTDCTNVAKKRMYDLNFLRIGPSTTGHASGLGGRHTEYPLVIEYDPRLTTDLPPGFRKVTR